MINPLRPLWDLDLNGRTFAAAAHSGVTDIINGINRVRLDTEHDYFNSGVMLMDLVKARTVVIPDEIFQCVREHESDSCCQTRTFSTRLYGKHTLPVDDVIWNYDARRIFR